MCKILYEQRHEISNNVVCATSKAHAQSDQSLCQLLEYSMTVKLLTEHHLEFLNLTGGCTGSSESTLVKTPHGWKSHVAALLYGPRRKKTCLQGVCEQQRCRPACASAQSDQHLCYSLSGEQKVDKLAPYKISFF